MRKPALAALALFAFIVACQFVPQVVLAILAGCVLYAGYAAIVRGEGGLHRV